MSITAVKERLSHTYQFRYDDGQPLPSQDLVRSFYVYSTTTDENPNTVRTASAGGISIPAYGAAHPSVPAALAQEFDVERDEARPDRWVVRVRYCSRRIKGGNNSDPNGTNQNPSLITKIVVSTVQGEKVIEEDIYGNAPQTTAGELLVLKVPWNELQMEFTQYRSVLDAAAYLQLAEYRNAINIDTWRGFAPRTARISSISGREVDMNGTTYLERQITVQLRDPNDPQQPDWRQRLLNAGYYIKKQEALVPGSTNIYWRKIKIRDKETGTPVTKPVPINQPGLSPLVESEAPYYLNISVYPELPFAALNL